MLASVALTDIGIARAQSVHEFGVELYCNNTYRVTPLRTEIIYPITVKNTGDLPDSYSFSFVKWSPTGEESKWAVGFSPYSLDLAPGNESIVNLSIKPTCTCQANLYILVTFIATSLGNNSINASIVTNTTAGDLGLAMDCAHPTKQTLISENANFSINLQNSGTVTERFVIEDSGLGDGWSASHESSVYLLPTETRTVTIAVAHPTNASFGSYSFNISAYPERGIDLKKTIALTVVIGYLGVEIALVNHSALAPGTDMQYDLRISNNGSIPDTYRLSLSNLPEYWAAEFPDGKQTFYPALDKSGTLDVVVKLRIPANVSHGTYGILIFVNSTTDPMVSDTVELSFPIFSDLVLKNATFPNGTVKVGEQVKLSATVANEGIATSENVTVKFYANHWLIGMKTIGELAPGEQETTSIMWTIKPERNDNLTDYRLLVFVEGSDEVNELNLSNNQLIQAITAIQPNAIEPNSQQLAGAIVIIALCAVGIAVLAMRSKPKTIPLKEESHDENKGAKQEAKKDKKTGQNQKSSKGKTKRRK